MREELEPIDLLDVLFDPDNKDPVVLMDADGKQMTFEQVAIIPHDEKLYCVLKPLDKIDGIADDEAIVFFVDEDDNGNSVVRVEENQKIATEVFEKYYDLYRNALENAEDEEE